MNVKDFEVGDVVTYYSYPGYYKIAEISKDEYRENNWIFVANKLADASGRKQNQVKRSKYNQCTLYFTDGDEHIKHVTKETIKEHFDDLRKKINEDRKRVLASLEGEI